MAEFLFLITIFIYIYIYIFVYISDPRADNWFMMQDPVYPLTAIVLYYLMVIFLPKFMEHREPFKLRWALIIYNAGLVLLCGWMVYEVRNSIYQEITKTYNYDV